MGVKNGRAIGLTSVLMMIAHQPSDYAACLVWSLLVSVVAVQTRSLGACVLMHAVSNFLLGLYIMTTTPMGAVVRDGAAVHGARYTVHGTRYTVHGTRYTVHGTRYTVHGSRYTVHGTRFTGHGSWTARTGLTVHVRGCMVRGRSLARWVERGMLAVKLH